MRVWLAVGLVLWGCSKPTPVAKKVEEKRVESAPAARTYAGVIAAQHTVAADSRVLGQMDSFFVEVGQDVKEGQALGRISGFEREGAESAAKAAWDAAQTKVAGLERMAAEAKLESAKLMADSRRAKAHADDAEKLFVRQKALFEVGATARKSFEQAQADAESSRKEAGTVAEFSRQAENRIYSLGDELVLARKSAEQRRGEWEASQAGVAAAEIHAPVAGVLVERRVEAGQPVTAENRAGLFVIAVQLGSLRAEFDGDETLRLGMPVEITVAERKVVAKITALDGVHAVVDFENSVASIRPGMPCVISVQVK